ncbi:hypothetical protein [Macrococcoides canis]|uniref:hypothetical protein n=1 Tax=Macrococcoides canis TaxID=1855823 RepID=UPI00165E0FF7|nr:hypothetical protein [Macrococcus canis]QNR07166.1 hypothetical protein GL258_02510 [Macrococcus canis]
MDNFIKLYQANLLKEALNNKINLYFYNPDTQITVFQKIIEKDDEVFIVEELIISIREKIEQGYFKEAFKLLVVLNNVIE